MTAHTMSLIEAHTLKPSTARRTYACAVCGRYGKAETMLFSRFTKNRYCSDLKACRKRAERRNRSAS